MASRTPRKKPTINLATAKATNGAQLAPRSVYEICGISQSTYKHDSLAAYSRMLNGLNLIELQEHAFGIGIPAGPDRSTLIDRLERRYLQENSRFRAGIDEPAASTASADQRAEAERILSRGR